MRKYHRWLSVFFGIFLLWIAVTGVLSQIVPIVQRGGSIVGLLHHLHSGESFGPLGTIIATLSGLAMVFFAFSGLWLYIDMWRNRSSRSLKPGWFWE